MKLCSLQPEDVHQGEQSDNNIFKGRL